MEAMRRMERGRWREICSLRWGDVSRIPGGGRGGWVGRGVVKA
jgi:hypothetical protein